MALWTRDNQKFYLPPAPVTKVLSTEEYVQRHAIYYHANTDRLLSVGHPYFPYKQNKIDIPKVSANQYRVFEVTLPNPNKFALPDRNIHNPEKNRLVWALRAVEVSRGQPIGVSVTGSPVFNRLHDVENPRKNEGGAGGGAEDTRVNMAFEAKQCQLLLVGCKPAYGEYWTLSRPCNGVQQQDSPPIELVSTVIEDGDMGEIGFGALDFGTLAANKADVPLDLVNAISKYPDYIKMSQDPAGDNLFFYVRRETEYARHFYTKAGTIKEAMPDSVFIKGRASSGSSNYVYGCSPSGSVVSTDTQIFNRPYWLFQAQGQNNGVCWHEKIYVTVLDNTRGTNFSISVSKDMRPVDNYQTDKFHLFLRHAEEYELSFILQLCTVALTPETVAHLHSVDPKILEEWEIGVNPQLSAAVENTYRYSSSATRCQLPPVVPEPPLNPPNYWKVDLSERLSLDLDQFPLGRRFLAQIGGGHSRKRKAPPSSATSTPSKTAKRRKR
ncbi:L1 [Equus caballus papillomavirus 4]|uniref:Major capsid protein L1 n=2 Tax=Papillomaviridae TaxID=151340 RepID=K9M9L5_9PAPI|nr:L1 [Equus caballus papillomavirus 4]AFJ00098.1 major capsid protein 1 [Equus caballus papillomavirus IV]AFS89109.1 L1 [Equus caballus papillomavirus 4]